MLEFIFTIAFIVFVTWHFTTAATRIRSDYRESASDIVKKRKQAIKHLITTPGTVPFLVSAVVAMAGIYVITAMMKGNLNGRLYSLWKQAIGFLLLGQFLPVLCWYLWRIK